MLTKWLTIGGIVLASLMYGSKVQAQAVIISCPEGYSPIGGADVQGCAPIPGYQSPRSNPSSGSRSAPPLESREYGKSYIAVAWHPKATDVWATWNQRTLDKATQTVANACTQVMGEGCGIVEMGWNGSVAIARNRNNNLWKGWGKTAEQAREVALRSCQSSSQDCVILHTFTSEPLKQPKINTPMEYNKFLADPANDVSKSYLPGKSARTPSESQAATTARTPSESKAATIARTSSESQAATKRGFLAIAWTGLSSQAWPNLVVASGYPTEQEAEKVAIARCQSESKQTCMSLEIIDDRTYPMFAVYLHGQKQAHWYSDTTEKNIERMADEQCRKSGVTCQKVGVFDARRSGLSIHPIKK